MNAKNRPLIPLESIVAGSLSGTLEASVNQPLIYIKNCIQLVRPPPPPHPLPTPTPTSPHVSAEQTCTCQPTLLVPWVCCQCGVLGTCHSHPGHFVPSPALPRYVLHSCMCVCVCTYHPTPTVFHKDMSRRNVVTSAFTAGAISGMITGPAESVIVNQQLHGNTILHTLRTIYTDAGLRGIFRGTPYVMFRDGSYTAGYIALAPMLGRHLHQLLREKMQWNLPWLLCNILSGIAVGSALSTLTHPIDTYKTVLQEDYSRKRHPNLLSVMRHVPWSKGFVPRISRICVGVCVLSISTTLLTDYLVVTNPFHVV
uniref:Citrate transport protein n=3 Tax=Lygus hesperus TaxID=30085 RepID=A0A146LPJ1_LYGHE